ncbi:MAG: DUF6573 family protein [Kribbellaceae bacterium]
MGKQHQHDDNTGGSDGSDARDHADLFGEAEVIHCYSRADAIADGILIDVTETAREAGFTVRVALTQEAWSDCVAWNDATDTAKGDYTGQSEAGRLWDVLFMTPRCHPAPPHRRTPPRGQLYRLPATGPDIHPRLARLHDLTGRPRRPRPHHLPTRRGLDRRRRSVPTSDRSDRRRPCGSSGHSTAMTQAPGTCTRSGEARGGVSAGCLNTLDLDLARHAGGCVAFSSWCGSWCEMEQIGGDHEASCDHPRWYWCW